MEPIVKKKYVITRVIIIILRFDLFILQTVRHGFPFQPTSLAFDPVQHLLAIGNRTGSLRMYPLKLNAQT